MLGDTIRTVVTVDKLKPMKKLGGGKVSFDVRVVNQREEVVQKGTWHILIRSRDEADGGE
jgi:acyl dehydratase